MKTIPCASVARPARRQEDDPAVEYADRRDAGRLLASELLPHAQERPIVVALPRGGVPVAIEAARALAAPLEILAVRKLGAPGNPELAVGALAEDGTAVLDPRSASLLGMTQAMVDATLAEEAEELRRRVERYRDGRPAIPVDGRTVIAIDDGMATGMTDLAAVRALRRRGARRVVVAVPVASAEAVSLLRDEADEVICPKVPRRLYGVGMWYADFAPISDEQVVELLVEAREPFSEDPVFDLGEIELPARLIMPLAPRGCVVFAHGSGSGRLSPRNLAVARVLAAQGFAALLFDLLTEHEARRRELVFDIALLAERLALVTRHALGDARLSRLPIGYFGASTGAAAALQAAGAPGPGVSAVVSRGGRPDLAGDHLVDVSAPTLLIVGSEDREVLELNRRAAAMLRCEQELVVVPGAGHLFEEPGALEQVAALAGDWFGRYLRGP
jgi:putative phosphoribosyl transferase